MSTGVCPDANELAAYLEGGAGRGAIAEHVAGCAACSDVLAELGRLLASGVARAPASTPVGGVATNAPRIARYRLEAFLGAGAMARVYAAHDARLGRRVALKVVGAGSSAALRARLLREARILAAISHPNVLPVYDADTFDGGVYLACELVEGATLRHWLAAQQRDALAVVGAYVQAARGLAAAHQRGVWHRDVKPDNILIGEDGRVRVSDFGLSTAASDDSPDGTQLTETGQILGTPRYMSPEAHVGGTVDGASDQFSLCAALYEALTGAPPFAGDSRAAIARAVHRGELAPVRTRCSPRLLAVVRRGLAVEPTDRFPSISALADALERAVRPRRMVPAVAAAAIMVAAAGLIVGSGEAAAPALAPPASQLQDGPPGAAPAQPGAAPAAVDGGLATAASARRLLVLAGSAGNDPDACRALVGVLDATLTQLPADMQAQGHVLTAAQILSTCLARAQCDEGAALYARVLDTYHALPGWQGAVTPVTDQDQASDRRALARKIVCREAGTRPLTRG